MKVWMALEHFLSARPAMKSILFLGLLGAAAYGPILRVGFLWDDHVIIETNPTLRAWSWDHIRQDFTRDNTQGRGDNYYRPLQAISHRLDYTLWGLNPMGYHLTGLLFHGLCAFLFYLLAQQLGLRHSAALAAACLFVVHPIGIEQFLTASGRTTPMCLAFMTATLVAWGGPGWARTWAGWGAAVLAFFTKESAAALPLLIAVSWPFLCHSRREFVVRLAGLMGIALVYGFLRSQAVPALSTPLDPRWTLRFLFHIFPSVLVHYAQLLLCPWMLTSHRLIPPRLPLWGFHWMVLVLWAWAAWRARDHRWALWGFGWFVISLLPTIPLMVSGGFMLDHWGYAMSLGLWLPAAWFLDREQHHPHRARMAGGWFIFFGLLISYASLTQLNIHLRNTDEKLYRWALRRTTSSPLRYNLGLLLVTTGRPLEAIPYLHAVRRAHPKDLDNLNVLARAYWAIGDRAKARQVLEEALAIHPSYPLSLETQNTFSSPRR